MSLKSEIHCPTSDTANKVTIESEINRLNKRQQRRKLKLLDDQYIKDLQDEDETCTFYYDIEEVDKRIKNTKENHVDVPEYIKTSEEFCDWIMNYDTTKIESAIELSKSVEGVEVLGYTKEARVKHMKQIFEDYKEK
jgi:hypothetical protein